MTLTVIFLERSPLAMAVETSAMLRTWAVRLPAMRIDTVGQVFPGSGNPLDLGLAAQLAVGADLARDAGHFRGERAKLVNHRVDGLADAEEFAPERAALVLQRNALGEIALGHGADDSSDFLGRSYQVADQGIHGVNAIGPTPSRRTQPRPLADSALLADDRGNPRCFLRALFEKLGHVVENIGKLLAQDRVIDRQPDAEITFPQRLERREELPGLVMPVARRQHRRRFRSGIRCSIHILVCMRSWSLFLDRHGFSLMVRT